MFRVTPGTDFPAGRASPSPRASTWGGGAAVVAVTLLGLLVTEPAARRVAPGETEVAQRAAAVVAGVYRGEGERGMLAVGWVVLNRMADKAYP